MEEKVKEVMAGVFGISSSIITSDDSVNTIAEWDSLNHINLIVALEQEFNIEFEEQQIPELNNINLIIETIQNKV